jgi:hypothetical protein
VLAYLSRYTHRVAIANSRLIVLDRNRVTFRWKDYRAEGRDRFKTMTLAVNDFIRRFLIHVLPSGFHRIRHYGLFASGSRIDNIARARELLAKPPRPPKPDDGVMRIGDLVQKTEDEILRIPGFGRKRLREIKEELARMGLHLGMEVPGRPPVTIKDLFPRPRRRRMSSL